MIVLKTPGVEANGDVVGERIGAGEVEVDQPGQPVAEEKHIVGKQIGMDDALRQAGRPVTFEHVEFGRDQRIDIALHLVGALATAVVKRPPAGDRQRVVAPHGKIAAGKMQPRQLFAHGVHVAANCRRRGEAREVHRS